MRFLVFLMVFGWAAALNAQAQQTTTFGQAVAAFNEKNYAESVPLFVQAENEAPGRTDALLYEGKALAHLEKFKEADAVLQQYVAQHPDSVGTLYLLGFVLNREDKPAESLKIYTRAAQLSAPKSDDLKIVATDYVLLDDYPDAIRWMRQAIEFDPKNEPAWYGLGRCYYTQSSFAEAEEAFRYALKLDPKDMMAHLNLALTLDMRNESAKAESEYRSAIALAETDPHTDQWPYLDYASFLLEQGRGAEAIPLLQKAITIAPQCAECHGKLGRALEATGKYDAAVAELEKAVALSPKEAKLHYALGHAYKSAGMIEKAREELAIAAKMYANKDGTGQK